MTISLKETARALGLQKDKDYDERAHYYCEVHDNETADLVIDHVDDAGNCYSANTSKSGFEKPVSLVMHTKQCSIEEAFQWLSEEFPEEYNEDRSEEDINRRKQAQKVLNTATAEAHKELKQKQQDQLQKIKEKRDFSDKTLEDAKIGFFSREIANTLKKRFDNQALVDSGLFLEKDNGSVFSHLKNRLFYPYTRFGNTEYAAGRVKHGKAQEADHKYKKAQQTKYNKHILYEFRENSNKEEVIITEGLTDAISAHQAGMNTITPATTTFKTDDIEKMVEKVKDHEKVYIAMDSDESGQEGQRKTSKQLLDEKVSPYLVDLGDENDLNDWTTKNGYNIENLLEEAEDYLEKQISDIKEMDKKKQGQESKELVKKLSGWDLIDIEWVLNELPPKKSLLEKQHKKARSEAEDKKGSKGEPSEPSERGEPHIAQDNNSAGGLLDQLENQTQNKSIRMSGIVNNKSIQTTFLQLNGLTKPFAFVKTNKDVKLLEIKHKLSEYPEDAVKNMSKDKRRQEDYYYIEINGEKIILDPQPVKITESLKTPTNDIVKYIKGQKQLDENLYDEIRDYISNHWFHFNEEWYDVFTAWIIHTYFLQDLSVTPYIFLTGVKDTGKSQAQRVLDQLCYHSSRTEDPTIPSMEREVTHSQATVHLDEMDKLGKDEVKRATKTINNGYNHGSTRSLVNTNKQELKDQNTTLYTYSAKSIAANGLHHFTDTVKSRAFIVDSTPKPEDVELEDIRKIDDKKEKKLNELRNQLFWLSIVKRKEIVNKIQEVKEDLDVENRKEDKLSIVNGIISFFKNKSAAKEITDFLQDQSLLQGKELSNNDEAFLKLVADNIRDGGLEIAFSALASQINNHVGHDEDNRFRVRPKKVGDKFRKYGLIQDQEEHKVRRSDGTYAKIPADIIYEQFKAHGFDNLASDIESETTAQKSKNQADNGSPGSLGSPGSPKGERRDITKKQFVQILANASGQSYYKQELKEAGYDIDQLYHYASEIEGIEEDFGIPQGSNETQNKLVLQKDKQKVLEDLEESEESRSKLEAKQVKMSE